MNTNNSHFKSSRSDVESPGRRKFMGWIVGIINLGLFTAIIVPVIGFIASPLRERRKGRWIDLMSQDDLEVGQIKEVSFVVEIKDGYRIAEHKYSVFLNRKQNEVVAFDPSCTHLGCRVKFQEGKKRFFCPCHGGVFDEDGRVVSGPPPRPLETYPVKVEGGRIWLYKEI